VINQRFRAVRFWLLAGLLAALSPLVSAQQIYTPPPPEPWDGTSRYTVLVMGMDRRPSEFNLLSSRSDVLILVSYDPATRGIGLFHIPRDLYLPLPDSGVFARVNTLSQVGEQRAAGYGPYHTMEVLSRNLGIQIDAFLLFDFMAFITLIDSMGGIMMDIPYSISDPTYPDMNFGYDPFFIQRGWQVLDGRTALKYARTRHGDNDYLRGQRQMAVMQAVFERLREPNVLQNMLLQAPVLVTQLRNNVVTNVPFEQLTFLGLVALDMGTVIRTGGFNESNTRVMSLGSGRVRVPRVELIPSALSEAFGDIYWN
jgi:LCP family protein required for cell wall assembly